MPKEPEANNECVWIVPRSWALEKSLICLSNGKMTPRCPLHGQLPPKASPASYYSLLGFIYILMLKLSSCHMYSTAIIAVNGPLLRTGQAFAVSGEGANLREALTRAHQAVSKISFDLPASSSCLAVQQTEPLPSLPAPLSLSLSLCLSVSLSLSLSLSRMQPFVRFLCISVRSETVHVIPSSFISSSLVPLPTLLVTSFEVPACISIRILAWRGESVAYCTGERSMSMALITWIKTG